MKIHLAMSIQNFHTSKSMLLRGFILKATLVAGLGISTSSSLRGQQVTISDSTISLKVNNAYPGTPPVYAIKTTMTGDGSGTNYGIHQTIAGIGAGDRYGAYQSITGVSTATHTGTLNSVSAAGSGIRYGMQNILDGNGSGHHYGTYQEISGAGNGNHFGTYNRVYGGGSGNHFGALNFMGGTGSGDQYGSYQEITTTNSAHHYATYNKLTGGGVGNHYGVYNTLSGGNGSLVGTFTTITTPNGTVDHYGSSVFVTGTGNGEHFGNVNTLNGSGTGDHTGTFNDLIAAGSGGLYGVHNELAGAGTGPKTGVYNTVAANSNSIVHGVHNEITGTGDGQHTGILNSFDKEGDGTTYGVRNQITNNGSGTTYGTHNFISAVGTGQHVAGYFSAPGVNNYAAIFHLGHVVANNNSQDYDFNIKAQNKDYQLFVDASAKAVGIGTNTPSDALHIVGVNTDDLFRVQLGTSTKMRIFNNGSISLGTNNTGIDAGDVYIHNELGIQRSNPSFPIHIGTDGTNGNGAHVTTGGTWTNGSSRAFKENFTSVDENEILRKLGELEILQWTYKESEEGMHLGPMAEDFHAAFGLGHDPHYIATVDADGVALAAIQALYDQLKHVQEENQQLKQALSVSNAETKAQIESLTQAISRLQMRIERE